MMWLLEQRGDGMVEGVVVRLLEQRGDGVVEGVAVRLLEQGDDCWCCGVTWLAARARP